MPGGLHELVISFKFRQNLLNGFRDVGGRKLPFPILKTSGLYNSLYYRTSRDNHSIPGAGGVSRHRFGLLKIFEQSLKFWQALFVVSGVFLNDIGLCKKYLIAIKNPCCSLNNVKPTTHGW